MAAIDSLIDKIEDIDLRTRIKAEVHRIQKQRKFGIVYEEHLPEATLLYDVPIKKGTLVTRKTDGINGFYRVLNVDGKEVLCVKLDETHAEETYSKDELVAVSQFGEAIYPYLKPIDTICNAPDSKLWHTLIEADNYHALQLLCYLYEGMVDCIYIDPPYNSGAKDWKYNNDYVDSVDAYKHSKWLSMMEKRLRLSKKLLNPNNSVLIVTIDEKEYLHLGCLLEQIFPESRIQMITSVINPSGTMRGDEFSRVEEYIYICRFGSASITKTDENMLGNEDSSSKTRLWYPFTRSNWLRTVKNLQFYPIYIDITTKRIVAIGDSMEQSRSQKDFPVIEGATAVFPIRDNGEEASWGAVPSTARKWAEKGTLRVGDYDNKTGRWSIQYIRSSWQEKIDSGEIVVTAKRVDGSLDIDRAQNVYRAISPKSVWNKKSHNATDYGTYILQNIFHDKRFTYPKSLYAVHDTIRFFMANNPNALVLDFFAGSGTTMHAVNLLNAEDGGNRRCIMVTNNEVSVEEAKKLKAKGLKPSDPEWEALGIAHYVTWNRTKCTILGKDIHGNPLKGDYLGLEAPMANGFNTNAAFFKLGFLDKTSVSLGRKFTELLPVLWMKAGAKGECPTITGEHDYIIISNSNFAVLINDYAFAEFAEELQKVSGIEVVFINTDSEDGYREMISKLNIDNTYQLYRDYLDNFTINYSK